MIFDVASFFFFFWMAEVLFYFFSFSLSSIRREKEWFSGGGNVHAKFPSEELSISEGFVEDISTNNPKGRLHFVAAKSADMCEGEEKAGWTVYYVAPLSMNTNIPLFLLLFAFHLRMCSCSCESTSVCLCHNLHPASWCCSSSCLWGQRRNDRRRQQFN